MKRVISAALIAFMCFSLVACGGSVSQEEYDKLRIKKELLEEQVSLLEKENSLLKDEINQLKDEKSLVNEDYKTAIIYYNKRDYEKAYETFANLSEDYKDTHLYLILCKGHIYGQLTDDDINELKKNLEFNDARRLLLLNANIAGGFLSGYWSSQDGPWIFEVYERGNSRIFDTNFVPGGGNYIYIDEGVFGEYQPKEGLIHDSEENYSFQELQNHLDEYDLIDKFRISILGKDRIAIVLLDSNERFILTRN